MKYDVRARTDMIANGVKAQANQVMATVETNLDADNLESLIRFGNVILSPHSGEELVDRPEARKAPEIPEGLPNPDELNALDAEEDEDEPETTKQESVRDLTGLAGAGTERIQTILFDAGMRTKADVQAKVESGFDLVDLDGIGRAAKDKILAWMTQE